MAFATRSLGISLRMHLPAPQTSREPLQALYNPLLVRYLVTRLPLPTAHPPVLPCAAQAPSEGYEKTVGRRTTFRLLNKLWTEKYGGRDGDGSRTPSRPVRRLRYTRVTLLGYTYVTLPRGRGGCCRTGAGAVWTRRCSRWREMRRCCPRARRQSWCCGCTTSSTTTRTPRCTTSPSWRCDISVTPQRDTQV